MSAEPDIKAMPESWPVYVDWEFTPPQKMAIRQAVDEWTTVLNGYRVYKIEDEDYRMEPAVLDSLLKSGQGLLILRNVQTDYPDEDTSGSLAFTYLGGQVIHVMVDTMGSRDYKSVLEHEIGHTLGINHLMVRNTVMYPSYPFGTTCIDEVTVRALASISRRGWRAEHMRWCVQ